MPSKKRQSFRKKFIFFATMLVLVVAGSFGYFIRTGQKKAVIDSQEQSRGDQVRALRLVTRQAILVDDDTDMVNYILLLKQSQSVAYAMVLHPDGRVRVHTDPLQIDNQLSDPQTQKSLNHRGRYAPLTQHLILPSGLEVLDMSIPIFLGPEPGEYQGVARIGFDKAAVEEIVAESLKEMDRRIFGAFVVSLIVGFIVALLLSNYIVRPLKKLSYGAGQIGEGKLDHRIKINTNDELEDLADDFNQMAVKLAELDQMKQDFVSNVTHELRSPLTSVRGYLDLLLNGAAGPISETQKDYLSVIKNSSVRLSRFIDNLLDVAKIEAARLKLTPEIQNIHDLVHEMDVLFKPQCDDKKIQFKNMVPSQLTPAFVDKDKLAEALINLTSNAIKFTPENGVIVMSAQEGGNHIQVRLEDSGVGIPKEMQQSVFNKFEQVKTTQGLARNQKGTGLGLAIVKGIIEAHGGKIWIESPVSNGRGTAFIFTIPKLTDEIKAKLDI